MSTTKEHYIFDIYDIELCRKVVAEVEKVTLIPKPLKKK